MYLSVIIRYERIRSPRFHVLDKCQAGAVGEEAALCASQAGVVSDNDFPFLWVYRVAYKISAIPNFNLTSKTCQDNPKCIHKNFSQQVR